MALCFFPHNPDGYLSRKLPLKLEVIFVLLETAWFWLFHHFKHWTNKKIIKCIKFNKSEYNVYMKKNSFILSTFLHSQHGWEGISFMWKMTFEIFMESLRFETPWIRKNGFYESVCLYSYTLLGISLQFRNFMKNFIKILLQIGAFKIHFMKIQLSFMILRRISENSVYFSQF